MCKVDFNQCLKGIFWSLPTNVTVGLFNQYLNDNSTDGNEAILDLWIYPNEDDFFEDHFSSPISLIEAIQNAGKNYDWSHAYVVNTALGLRSFNDPCIYIQNTKGDDGAFWDWFEKRIRESLEGSLEWD